MRQAVIFDSLRERRNDIQYSLEPFAIEDDLVELYNEVESFLEKVKDILGT